MKHSSPATQELEPGTHLCFLYETEEEHCEVISDFLRQGLDQNHKIIYILETHTADQISACLGVNEESTQQAIENGKLTFLNGAQVFRNDGGLNPLAMVRLLQEKIHYALAEGYEALRIAGEMNWFSEGSQGSERLFECEAELDKLFADNAVIGLCQYDKQRFHPETLQELLRMHPLVIVGKTLCRNIYYIPPAALQDESRAQAELDHWIDNLTDTEQTRQEQELVLDTPHNIIANCDAKHKQSEAALAEYERRFQKMLGVIPDLVSIHDPDMNILYSNWHGFGAVAKEKRVLNTKCYKTYRGYDDICPDCLAKTVLETGEAVHEDVEMPDGTWKQVSVATVLDNNNKVEFFVEWVACITDRKRMEESLEYRLGLEERISAASNRFINSVPEEFDQAVHDTLASIGEFVGAGRAYIFQFHNYQRLMSNTYEWCAPGVTPQIDNIQDFPTDKLPWFMLKLRGREVVHIPRVRKLPPEAYNLRLTLERQDIKSLIVVPIVYQNELAGFIGFDGVYEEAEWSSDTVSLLQTTGEILTNALKRHRTEAALRTSEEKYRSLLQNIESGVVVHDADTRIIDANPKACTLLGFTLEKMLGKAASEQEWNFLNADGGKISAEDFPANRVASTKKPVKDMTIGIVTPGTDIVAVWVVADAKPVFNERGELSQIIVAFMDITSLKDAEKACMESEQKYKSLFYETPLGTFHYNLDGLITECNQSFMDIIGSSRESLVGLNMVRDLKNDRIVQEVKRSLTEGFGYYEGEYTSVSGGKTTVVRVMFKGLRNEDDEIVSGLGLVEDITERHKAEQQLQKALDDLRRAQQHIVEQERQRALTTMASGVVHDFNNALFHIQGFSRMLLENPEMLDDRENTFHYLNNIHKAANSAAETIRRMRKFYRPGEVTSFTVLDLNSIIMDAVSVTEPRWKEETRAAGKEIEVQAELDDIPPVCGNEAELNDIMINLIFNAVDAMPEGGRIAISTYMQDEQYICLEFSDNGIGMSEGTKQKCLDPFYTEKGSEGSGLGLATVQGGVRRHSGELYIESAEGEGTTFYITLPVAESTGEPEGNMEKQTDGLRILVVEDHELQRMLLHDMLTKEGHYTETASNGIEGLEKFSAGSFDLVITDRAMPEMNGDYLAAKIKETTPGQPVIMLTGFGDMMEAAGDKPSNVDSVISKTNTKEKIQEEMSRLMRTESEK